jgi:hypothetical protein
MAGASPFAGSSCSTSSASDQTPDETGGAGWDDATSSREDQPAATLTPRHRPWPRNVGVAIQSSFLWWRTSRFTAAPSITAGRSRAGTAAKEKISRRRSPGLRCRRARARSRCWSMTPTPRPAPSRTGSAGDSAGVPRGSERARPHRSRGATTSARAATGGRARRPATAATATPSASTRLDSDPDLPPGAGKRELERALDGHTRAVAELIGTYER